MTEKQSKSITNWAMDIGVLPDTRDYKEMYPGEEETTLDVECEVV